MRCEYCGLPLVQTKLVTTVFTCHDPEGLKNPGDVKRAVECFNRNRVPLVTEEPHIPALWRTTGHWNAVWKRSS